MTYGYDNGTNFQWFLNWHTLILTDILKVKKNQIKISELDLQIGFSKKYEML